MQTCASTPNRAHTHTSPRQDDAIRNLFSSKTKREYTVSSLVVFVSAFYALAVITYGISCPTGLFVPSILCGAAYGRLVGGAQPVGGDRYGCHHARFQG